MTISIRYCIKYVAESTTALGGAIVVNVATVLRHKLRN